MNTRSLVVTLIALFLAGCGSPPQAESKQGQTVEPFSEVAKLADGLYQYIQANGSTPASKEEFQSFCSASRLPCSNMDWSKVSWKSADSKRVVVIYGGEGYSMPITVENPGR